ncbi:uncharacterized protein CFAP92 isoform X1 [Ahaetulla prasina]|uniref:uncharacterized protein CFAP92 isoform X1 n=2 Tax=Ahaetulla prasina TaxID=499056 RepID=UPI002648D565|nr:uncharacterized protein CFAP92 isoform X1 [Ahaetulla prasina]
MASKQLDPEGENEEEEAPEADFNETQYSGSSYVTESPEMCGGGGGGGGHPTPIDEHLASVHSMRSQELNFHHLVTCTFSVSLAVPLTLPTNKPWQSSKPEIQRSGSKAKEGFIPKMHRFYHMEYFLLPDDIEPRKLDLVLFGPVAKLFLDTESKPGTPKDNERSKVKKPSTLNISVVKPWLENDQIWISWNHSIEIDVTNEFLIKLRGHSIKLRLWDLKEKVCSKARFCKLKSNLLTDQGEFEGNVKSMVLYQREFLQYNEAKPSVTKVKPVAPFVRKQTADALSALSKRMENGSGASDQKYSRKFSFTQPPAKPDELNRSLSALSFSGSIDSSFKEKTIQDAKIIKQKHRVSLSRKHSALKTNGSKPPSSDRRERASTAFLHSEKRRPSQKSNIFSAEKKSKQATQRSIGKEAAALAAQARKFGIAALQLDLIPLLAGEYYTASRWEENSPKLNEAYLGFAVDKPIMSEKHKHDLNPLIIKIKSAKCLPNTPVPIEELQRTCLPVYCKYTFYEMCPHYTQRRDHGTDIFFKDTNVILVGSIDPGKFYEYLRGPPLEIEIHDRDKKMEDQKMTPSLFGEEPGDSKLSDIGTVTSRYMAQNLITAKENICSPYGVAKINLNDLLLGEKTLNFCAPIHNCSIQDISGKNTSPGAKKMDDSQVVQLSIGHYVNAESYLKVRVEISVPLGPAEEDDVAGAAHCPYGCIIYLFDYNNTSFLYYLMQEITEINSEAFLLDSYPIDTTQKSLNTLKLNQKLSFEEISRLNIITGFHIIDGSIHLLILEGFRNKALKRLWNKKIDRVHEAEHGRLQIFYNSHLSFHKRLYIDLEAILLHIRLCKPLSSIMKQPLLYLRDMVPQPCFEALSRLDFICHSKKLREVVHYNLLPSAEMITMLSQEFGVPLTKADMYVKEPPEILETFDKMQKDSSMRHYGCSHLDNYNKKYVLRKRKQESQAPHNYIQSNIEYVNFLNEILEREIPRTIRAFPFGENAIFNYSTQALNSAEIAKKLLRQEMAKMPGKRFAYNEYLSGMFDPVDEESILKERIQQSKKLWLYPGGFANPGFKSSADSNIHPRRPDEARLIELREKWQENFFNANFMKPVLDRDRWRWDKRDVDFELYRMPIVQNPAPDTRREEPTIQATFNTALKVHRCCPATELISSGPKASCQIARLQGLLKDKPIKSSLKMQSFPVLGVLDNVEESRPCKGFVPGADIHRSLMSSHNIPCYDRAHNAFKTLKGADFRLICQNRSYHYKRYPTQDSCLKKHVSAMEETEKAGNVGMIIVDSVHVKELVKGAIL